METFFNALTAGFFLQVKIFRKTTRKAKGKGEVIEKAKYEIILKITPVKIRKFSCQPKYFKKTKLKPKERGEYIEKAKYEIMLKINQVENYRLNRVKN